MKMSRARTVFDHWITYLDTSPIARVVYWTVDRSFAAQDDNRPEESPISLTKEDKAQRRAAQVSLPTVSAYQGFRPRHVPCARHVSTDHANNKVHDWPLGRRIFIAAVISWYT
jgi:hypothetical protein